MNVIKGLINFIENKDNIKTPDNVGYAGNIMNLQGDYLEEYVKNALAGVTNDDTNESAAVKISSSYCYCGNSNNPPDLVTSSYEALEIKKKNSLGGTLPLNSSFPKDYLYENDTKITASLKQIFNENDIEKMKMFYIIGFQKNNSLYNLLIISADLFCSDETTYKRIINVIKDGIELIEGVEFSETKELGKIKNIDNLGYTDLRIRGMWNIKNPLGNENIRNLTIPTTLDKTTVTFLISNEDYETYPNKDEFEVLLNTHNIELKEAVFPSPNNPANFINSKRIDFEL